MADQRIENALQSLEKEVLDMKYKLSRKNPTLRIKDYFEFLGLGAEDTRDFTAAAAPGTAIIFPSLKAYVSSLSINSSATIGLVEVYFNNARKYRIYAEKDISISFDKYVQGDLKVVLVDGATPIGTMTLEYYNLKNFDFSKLLNPMEVFQ